MAVNQIDPQMTGLDLAPGVSVRDYGCLTVALFNILKKHRRIKSDFRSFLGELKKNHCYTRQGLLMWEPFKLVCGVNHRILPKNEGFKTEDKFEYIVQVPYKDTGHFCEVYYVAKDGLIIYRDSYDGELKEILRGRCLSVREITLL